MDQANNKEKIGQLTDSLFKKEQELVLLKQQLRQKEQQLEEIKTSVRWQVAEGLYQGYKKRVKKFIPRFVFRTFLPGYQFLKNYGYKNKRILDVKKIQNLSFQEVQTVEFSQAKDPLVSIIIPVYNKWQYTYHCLSALKENGGEVAYEVIVVDDASTDETADLMKKMKNVVYVKNKKNVNFLASCNNGASYAKGKYLVLLNNDTHVQKNWLEMLLKTFEIEPQAGLVGSKLVYPDGRLQEAGGIVWKNENVWNYGRFADPDSYEFNYLKEADYCTGAAIMIRADLYQKLGGLDPLYTPAYFEETDLAFRIRQAGYKVLYQPLAEVIHFEGISQGTDVKNSLKRHQVLNSEKFFQRWKDTLAKEGCEESTDGPFLARDRAKSKKIMLYLDNNVPSYDKDAGSFVAFEYLKVFKNLGFKIIFWPHNLTDSQPYTQELQQLGIEVVYGQKIVFADFLEKYGRFIDVAVVSRPHLAEQYLAEIKQATRAKVIYIPHDLYFLRLGRAAELSQNPEEKKEAEKMKALEKSIMQQADVSLTFSDKEKEIIEQEFSAKAEIAPWIQPINIQDRPNGFLGRQGVLFVGGFLHQPNLDAVQWFHGKIMPKIKVQVPDFQVYIIGSNAPEEIRALNAPDFQVLGFAEDLGPFFDQTRILIAPLRFGAGFKGKIAMAMSYGVPVVTTEIGAEGIGLVDGQSALIADDEQAFAQKVIDLYRNQDLWEKVAANSLEHVRKNYSAENAQEKMEKVLKELAVL